MCGVVVVSESESGVDGDTTVFVLFVVVVAGKGGRDVALVRR